MPVGRVFTRLLEQLQRLLQAQQPQFLQLVVASALSELDRISGESELLECHTEYSVVEASPWLQRRR